MLSVISTLFVSHAIATPLFAHSSNSIAEAPATNLLELRSHPSPQNLIRSSRGHNSQLKDRKRSIGGRHNGGRHTGDAIVNTIFSGVYPVVNVTWGSTKGGPGQTFISFIDTGQFKSEDSDVINL
jgi:hypothetical protein